MAIDCLGMKFVWEQFPLTAAHGDVKRWILNGVMLGLAPVNGQIN